MVVWLGERMSLFLGVVFWKYLGLICHDVYNFLSNNLQEKDTLQEKNTHIQTLT